MTSPTPQPQPATPLDVGAILADLQEQLDDLTATVQAQQQTLDRLATQLPGRG